MGVRYLNQYLLTHAKGINQLFLRSLYKKKVVIDTSIYMYKFKSQDVLLENMEKFIILLKDLCIYPIFVFDGEPKMNKKRVLKERRQYKQRAWKKYNECSNLSKQEQAYLKSNYTRVSKKNTDDVKILMAQHDVMYIDAPHEADELCARLMLTNNVYACISDDMDMLLYGCTRVIRNIDIDTKTGTLYNLNTILSSLKMTHYDFKQVCILSGSDYYKSLYTIFETIKLYSIFKKSNQYDFYTWICTNTNINYNELMLALNMYSILNDDFNYLDQYIKPQELQESASENAGSCIAEG
jgi:5'-3' exonuclease